MRFDEKWDFVGEKERNRTDGETHAGDCWDHVARDPESRLVVSLVVGKRTTEATRELVEDFHRRTGGRADPAIDHVGRVPRVRGRDSHGVQSRGDAAADGDAGSAAESVPGVAGGGDVRDGARGEGEQSSGTS